MKLGGRIAIYVVVCGIWAGILYLAAAVRYTDLNRQNYAMEVEFNRHLLEHRAKMAELKAESAALDAKQAVYKACMKRHADVSDPSIVNFCDSMAGLELSRVRLKALTAANAAK